MKGKCREKQMEKGKKSEWKGRKTQGKEGKIKEARGDGEDSYSIDG